MGDDIIGMAVSGMLATDMTPHFTDPGPLPSINTVFMTWAKYKVIRLNEWCFTALKKKYGWKKLPCSFSISKS